MVGLGRAIAWVSLLCGALALSNNPQDFSGTVEMLPDPTFKCTTGTAAECTKCQQVCDAVFTCLSTATVATTGVSAGLSDGDNKWGIMTGSGGACPVTPFQVTFTRPQPQAADVKNVTVGALVQRSSSSSFTIKNAATFFVQGRNFQDNVVQGTMIGQCDGLSMYFTPGGFCDCQADFKVTSGSVMTVDAEQPAYVPAANPNTDVGSLYLLRVKQNPDLDDFRVCNETFMGAYAQAITDCAKPPCGTFQNQCFRNLTVQQSVVTRYNVATCGTQLYFFNKGTDQSVTNCRDGLGVVSDLGDGTQGISNPAGVFYPRGNSQPAAIDQDWFFMLTPAKLAKNASAQFDLELKFLSTTDGTDGNLRQLTCIAEAKVDGAGASFLNASYVPIDPNSALTAALSSVGLVLSCLLSILMLS